MSSGKAYPTVAAPPAWLVALERAYWRRLNDEILRAQKQVETPRNDLHV